MRAKHGKTRKMALRVLSTATFLTMVASCAAPAFADAYGIAEYKTWYVSDGNISVVGNQVTVKDKESHETTETDDDITITGSSNEYNVILNGANVTIKDLEIDASKTDSAAILTGGKTTIELEGNNKLTGGEGHAGLEKWSNGQANNLPDYNHTLTIKDDDNDGKLTATGGAGGAGIGGASTARGYVNNITVTGGTIEAIGGEGSAGIGGGKANADRIHSGNCDNITISGKDTTVTATGGEGGAGIGGGKGSGQIRTGQSHDITIKDGAHVEATGGAGGSGIGGGDGSLSNNTNGLGTNIEISGDGTYVKATGDDGGAGIGGGRNGQGQFITIEGDVTVIANGSGGGAGIGGGENTSDAGWRGCGIDIKDGNVTANGGADGGAGIGGGKGGSATIKSGSNGVNISGGTVTANGGTDAAGIGSGADNTYNKGSYVSVSGGDVTANGGTGAAGIGDGVNNKSTTSSDISITGGTVKANGGAGNAAGIGAGENDAHDAKVTINATTADLDVTATTQGTGEAISGQDGLTMADLENVFSGIVKFFHGDDHYNTVHNGKYVGMDTNDDNHEVTDAHIWGDTEIIKQATPTEKGVLRHYCAVDGCKGYYDEEFDYVEPAPDPTPDPDPDTPDPVTPVTPDPVTPSNPTVDPVTPENPVNPPVQDATADDVTPSDTPVTPDNAELPPVQDARAEETAETPVTPADAVNPPVQDAHAAPNGSVLPQTGANWLAVLGSALSGMFLMAAGFVLNRKHGENH